MNRSHQNTDSLHRTIRNKTEVHEKLFTYKINSNSLRDKDSHGTYTLKNIFKSDFF